MEKIRISIDDTLKQYWIPILIKEVGGDEDFWYEYIFKGLEQNFNELREDKDNRDTSTRRISEAL